MASALAFFHPEVIHGTAPSSGLCIPRFNEVSPDYIESIWRDGRIEALNEALEESIPNLEPLGKMFVEQLAVVDDI